jgi:Skp family chaperone for outer membrane proteins
LVRIRTLVVLGFLTILSVSGNLAERAFAQVPQTVVLQTVPDPDPQTERDFLQREFPNEYKEIQRLAQMDRLLNRQIRENLRRSMEQYRTLQTKLEDVKRNPSADPHEQKRLETQIQDWENKHQRLQKSLQPHMLKLQQLHEQRQSLHVSFVSHYRNQEKAKMGHVLKQWIANGNETVRIKQTILKRINGNAVL